MSRLFDLTLPPVLREYLARRCDALVDRLEELADELEAWLGGRAAG